MSDPRVRMMNPISYPMMKSSHPRIRVQSHTTTIVETYITFLVRADRYLVTDIDRALSNRIPKTPEITAMANWGYYININ